MQIEDDDDDKTVAERGIDSVVEGPLDTVPEMPRVMTSETVITQPNASEAGKATSEFEASFALAAIGTPLERAALLAPPHPSLLPKPWPDEPPTTRRDHLLVAEERPTDSLPKRSATADDSAVAKPWPEEPPTRQLGHLPARELPAVTPPGESVIARASLFDEADTRVDQKPAPAPPPKPKPEFRGRAVPPGPPSLEVSAVVRVRRHWQRLLLAICALTALVLLAQAWRATHTPRPEDAKPLKEQDPEERSLFDRLFHWW